MADLSGLHVLNTRPLQQAAGLTLALRATGAQVSELPLIEIVPRYLTADEERLLLDLDRFDGVIVVSANAARLGLDAVAGCWPQWPYRLPVYAVGRGTAAVLEDAGLHVIVPAQADSEGVLALPALTTVEGQRFLLWRGENGRELLRDTLAARGATVQVLSLYHRVVPATAVAAWKALAASLPQVVVLTSPDALRHWQQVAGAEATRLHWLVVSPRMRALAEAAGARVTEAQGADTPGLLRALEMVREQLAI